jgi:DUF4097 and DUF4098 domain-containing protein YvlB
MKKLLLISVITIISLASVAQKQVTKTFSNVTSIDVKGAFCDVIIKTVPGNTVKFLGSIKTREDRPIRYSQSGSNLKIWVESHGDRHSETHELGILEQILLSIFDGNYSYEGLLELEVPVNTNILVNNSSGSIMASDLGGNNISLNASSGRIRCANILSSLNVKTSSGAIEVHKVKGNLYSKSLSGSQRISEIGGSLKSSASSGSISVDKVYGSSHVSSLSGGVKVSNLSSTLYASSSSGMILIDDVEGNIEASSLSGGIKLKDVRGTLNLKTTSGSIKGESISLTNSSSFSSLSGTINMSLINADKFSYDLEAGSGRLKALGHSGSKKLLVIKDQLWVKGRSSSGSQTFM